MEIVILILCAIGGFWLVSKIVPGKTDTTAPSSIHLSHTLDRPWYEVLEVRQNASDAEIEERYRSLSALYTDEAIEDLEPELQAEAHAGRKELDAAYHFSQFRPRK